MMQPWYVFRKTFISDKERSQDGCEGEKQRQRGTGVGLEAGGGRAQGKSWGERARRAKLSEKTGRWNKRGEERGERSEKMANMSLKGNCEWGAVKSPQKVKSRKGKVIGGSKEEGEGKLGGGNCEEWERGKKSCNMSWGTELWVRQVLLYDHIKYGREDSKKQPFFSSVSKTFGLQKWINKIKFFMKKLIC